MAMGPMNSLCVHGHGPALESERLNSSRMLKKSASGVLASLRGSTYGTEYDSPFRSLRPCWTAFLSILRGCLMSSATSIAETAREGEASFSATC